MPIYGMRNAHELSSRAIQNRAGYINAAGYARPHYREHYTVHETTDTRQYFKKRECKMIH